MSDFLGELDEANIYPGYPLGGLTIIESPYITKTTEVIVPRSWKERLFTRPWRPFQSTKVVIKTVPGDDFYACGTTLVGHPITVARLRESLAQERIADQK